MSQEKKIKVTVIGLGKMGKALASAFIQNKVDTTIWNRDLSKSESLVKSGAKVAAKASEAIKSNPIIIVCISNYEAVKSVFCEDEMISFLKDKIVIQLSTGTPKDACDFAHWVEATGAAYIDGRILSWTKQIGTPEATIMVSGKEEVYNKTSDLLKILAGNLIYMGEDVKKPAAMFSATLSYLAGHWIGLSYGALICERGGVDVVSFGSMLNEMAPFLGQESSYLAEVISNDNFSNPESTIKTAGEDIIRLVRHANESGISDEYPKFAASLFQQAIDAGYGEEEHSALIKIMR